VGEEEKGHKLVVTVHDEDDGNIYRIPAEPEELVAHVVERLYTDLHRDRLPGDRLRCEGGGGDVFGYQDERVEHYARTQCDKLVWLFTGDQGGASA
jgi:hypothetical protein